MKVCTTTQIQLYCKKKNIVAHRSICCVCQQYENYTSCILRWFLLRWVFDKKDNLFADPPIHRNRWRKKSIQTNYLRLFEATFNSFTDNIVRNNLIILSLLIYIISLLRLSACDVHSQRIPILSFLISLIFRQLPWVFIYLAALAFRSIYIAIIAVT